MESYHTDDEDNEVEEKMNRLLEMFPQLTRKEVLEVSRKSRGFTAFQHKRHYPAISLCTVLINSPFYSPISSCSKHLVLFHFQVIGSTSTLDGAITACLFKYGDKEGTY